MDCNRREREQRESIVNVLLNGEADDSPPQPAGFLFLYDVTALEVDWRF